MIELIIISLITAILGGFIAIFFIARSLLQTNKNEVKKSNKTKFDKITVNYYLRLSAKIAFPLSIALTIYSGIRFIYETFAQHLFPLSIEALYLSFESNTLIYLFIGLMSLGLSIAVIKKTNAIFGFKARTNE